MKKLFKSKSENFVVSSIIENDVIDRTSLSKVTGMSLPAISKIVRNLIDRGIVEEIGTSTSSGGRKPILLKFNSYYRFAIGIKIGLGYVYVIVTDFVGNVILRFAEHFDRTANPENTLMRLLEKSKERIKSSGIEIKKIIGIGVAISGSVDQEKGTLIFSSILGWENVEISKIFNKVMKVPVVVLNDVKSFTLAQVWKGAKKEYKNFLVVTIGTGIGLGIVTGRKLYVGNGNAGEFGHIVVNSDGEKCTCGRKGCLETEVSFGALVRKIKARDNFEIDKVISVSRENEGEETLLQILRITKEKNESLFKSSFENFKKFLGTALVDLVNIFNPPLIILGGEALEFGEYFIKDVSNYIHDNAFNAFGKNVEIAEDTLGEDAWSFGVIYLLIQQAFGKEPIIKEVMIKEKS
ncbi:MAG: ROK family protein [Thermotogae bacterium]|nr:ROK family protein [Thermotogota bacterium]